MSEVKKKQKFYSDTDKGGVSFLTTRRPGDVRIPNFVYDMWMPLIGSDSVGVYGVYCRLERQGSVKAMKLLDIARACRIGMSKLNRINATLEDCGFITVQKPTGRGRLMHWTSEITTHDPPQEIRPGLMKKYKIESGYQILCPWLKHGEAKDQMVSPKDTKQALGGVPNGDSNIESLDLLNPLRVEGTPPDFLQDITDRSETPLDNTLEDPSDQYFAYGDQATQAFQTISGAWGRTAETRETQKDLIRGGVIDRPDFDPARWEQSIKETIANISNAGKISRMWQVYDAGGTYQQYIEKTYFKDGSPSPIPANQYTPPGLTAEEWAREKELQREEAQ